MLFQKKFAVFLSIVIVYFFGYLFYRNQSVEFLNAASYGSALNSSSEDHGALIQEIKGKISGDLLHNNKILFVIYYPVLVLDPKFKNIFG